MSRPRASLVPAIVVLASASVGLPQAEPPPPEAAGDLRPRRVRELPFDLEAVEGLRAVPDLLPEARKLLSANGFVVVGPAHGSMPDCYRRSHEIPPLVTVDSVLEVFLCQGGCFDYRELDLPPGRALTAEGFRELMDSAAAPAPPRWTGSYRVEPAAAAPRR